VRIADGSLALELADTAAPPRRLRLERDVAGAVRVDGAAVELEDATAACTPPAPPPPPPPVGEPRLDATLVALARALADRTVAREIDRGGSVEAQQLSLCADGRAHLVSVVTVAGSDSVETLDPPWTIRVADGATLLSLATDGGPLEIPIALGDGGEPLVDSAPAELGDARGACADLALRDRLTQALGDTAFFFTETVPGVAFPVRIKIGLCASGRHAVVTTASPRTGPWQVAVSSGVAELQLLDDAGAFIRRFPVAFGDDGVVQVNGLATPVDDPSLVALACGG
jgi:hypothetical protein